MTWQLLCQLDKIELKPEPTEKLSKLKLVKDGYIKESDILEKITITKCKPKNPNPKHPDYKVVVDVEEEIEIIYQLSNALGIQYFVHVDDAIKVAKTINKTVNNAMSGRTRILGEDND